jgi:hypothetical protein
MAGARRRALVDHPGLRHEPLFVLDEARKVIARAKNALTGAGVDPKLTSQL